MPRGYVVRKQNQKHYLLTNTEYVVKSETLLVSKLSNLSLFPKTEYVVKTY